MSGLAATDNAQDKARSSKYSWCLYAGIALVIILVRALTNSVQLHLPFVGDEVVYLNYAKTTPPFYIITACIQYYFRPVVHIFYWLMLNTVGMSFVGQHLLLIVLHAFLAVVFALFLRRLTGISTLLASLCALVWGLYGGYDEVYYFTSSFATELLGAWFLVLSLWLGLRHIDGDGPFWPVILCLILAYGSKEPSIVIIPMLAILCLWRRRVPDRWLFKLFMLLIPTLIYLALEYYLQVVVAGSMHKPNTNIYYPGLHVLRNIGQLSVMIIGGGLWLPMSSLLQSIATCLLIVLLLWWGKREGLLSIILFIIVLLPFCTKTLDLTVNNTRHIYLPSMFWWLIPAAALGRLNLKNSQSYLPALILGIWALSSAISGTIWIDKRYPSYKSLLYQMDVLLRHINVELQKTDKPLPLLNYNLLLPGQLNLVNNVYFENRLVDLSGLDSKQAIVKAQECGYNPPCALTWEQTGKEAWMGKNTWIILTTDSVK